MHAFFANAPTWTSLLASHVLQVTLLAAIVLTLGRLVGSKRPRLTHALWALVLLKCLCPPVISSPLSPYAWLNPGLVDDAAPPARQPQNPVYLLS